MVAVVSTERLTLSRQQQQCSARHARETIVMISEEEFAAIRACVAKAFGFVASSYLCDALAEEPKIVVDSI
jgi:tRNA A37 threonylcarbamoyladenosine dehydratase